MEKLLLVVHLLTSWLLLASCMDTTNETEKELNSTKPGKDMYVINAMVYQVGILTNKTDNGTANLNTTGHQEALTFYGKKGDQVDLSLIPPPLLTNISAQSLVGVAPVNSQQNVTNQMPWGMLSKLTGASSGNLEQGVPSKVSVKSIREVNTGILGKSEESFSNLYKRLYKRQAPGSTPVAISKGSAVIPSTAGVQSIAIPPLLTLNNNLSDIPVPIPNTSVIHYAKINTLVTKP